MIIPVIKNKNIFEQSFSCVFILFNSFELYSLVLSGIRKHPVETDVLFFIKPERILVARSFQFLSSLSGNFWVIIHSIIKMTFDLGERPASQSEHLCRTNVGLSDKGTARYRLATVKIRFEKIPTIVSANPRSGAWSRCRFLCNVTAVFRVAKALSPAINGLDGTSELFRTKGVLSWCVQSFMHSFVHS